MKGQSDINQGSEGDRFKIFLHARQDGKNFLNLPPAVKNIVGCESVWNS